MKGVQFHQITDDGELTPAFQMVPHLKVSYSEALPDNNAHIIILKTQLTLVHSSSDNISTKDHND